AIPADLLQPPTVFVLSDGGSVFFLYFLVLLPGSTASLRAHFQSDTSRVATAVARLRVRKGRPVYRAESNRERPASKERLSFGTGVVLTVPVIEANSGQDLVPVRHRQRRGGAGDHRGLSRRRSEISAVEGRSFFPSRSSSVKNQQDLDIAPVWARRVPMPPRPAAMSFIQKLLVVVMLAYLLLAGMRETNNGGNHSPPQAHGHPHHSEETNHVQPWSTSAAAAASPAAGEGPVIGANIICQAHGRGQDTYQLLAWLWPYVVAYFGKRWRCRKWQKWNGRVESFSEHVSFAFGCLRRSLCRGVIEL
ncbi:unnamed protein product, partial [Ectocarpus sp. 6 AP-2014]